MAPKPPKSDDETSDRVPVKAIGSSRAEQRKQRLAEQLRENLKKRKELARSRKTGGDGSI